MDLRLTPPQRALRDEAAAFCASVRPVLEADPEWRRQGMLSDGDSREVNRLLGEAGWIGLSWPEALGGRGLSRLDATLVEEILGYHWLPLSSYLLSYKTIGAAIERFAPALARELLPPIARGELVFCQGFSEPGAGSDLGALSTRAELDGDTWVVNGHKLWTSSAQLADWIYLAVRTDPDRPRHRGISVLVCPMDTPGIEVRTFGTLGGGFLCETFLDGVRIPAGNLVGERAGGWEVLMYTLDFERITAEKLGGAAWVLDATEARLQETDRLDRAAAARLERLRGQLGAARLLSFRAADVLDRGLPGSSTSALAKLAGARVVQAVGDATVDLLGLEGLGDGSADAVVEGRAAALYRASAGSTIAGGVSDVQKLVIARRGLGLR